MNIKNKIKLMLYLYLQYFVNVFSDIFIMNKLRYLFYLIYFKSMGRKCILNAKIHIEVPDKISMDNNCVLNRGCWISGGGGLEIQDNIRIDPNVIIHTANHNFTRTDLPFRSQGHTYKKVVICSNVWIGAAAIILPGVKIHSNSVVAAGAVVTKDVPEGVVVGSVPAKIIKKAINGKN